MMGERRLLPEVVDFEKGGNRLSNRLLERGTRLELATTCLEGRHSTN